MRDFTFSLADLFTVVTVAAIDFAALAADPEIGANVPLYSTIGLWLVLREGSRRRRRGVPLTCFERIRGVVLLSAAVPLGFLVGLGLAFLLVVLPADFLVSLFFPNLDFHRASLHWTQITGGSAALVVWFAATFVIARWIIRRELSRLRRADAISR